MEVSGQPHHQATLPSGEEPPAEKAPKLVWWFSCTENFLASAGIRTQHPPARSLRYAYNTANINYSSFITITTLIQAASILIHDHIT